MSNEKKLNAIAYGEVLWDVFTNEKKIGGAPLNVALRMKSLGCDVAMISCVGNDEDGKAIIETVKDLGLETASIITSKDFPTGLVNVTLDQTGSATYEIKYPSAWDKIILNNEARKLTNDADVLIYGSLVCRDEVSRKSLEELLQTNTYKVFDVNLRKPHYTYEILEKLMKSANFVKFNDEEILEISSALNFPHTDLKENMNFISSLADVKGICVTRGKHGALLLWEGTFYENIGYPIVVADTVGAGDSFLATLVTSLLTDKKPQEALDLACVMGALVAGSPGANPKISLSQIEDLMRGKVE
ncbi:carbohydrate kinase [Flavobacterium sp. WLB]|uniref:carbohydrate kinase family protein n=1 Tax=unclassified Flavobacterium TaxID=196869 RepID=UPI0006AB7950|nr:MULTISPECIES: carbohydrate kinase [unclassified Flavobacterium]KOP38324.1 carbohydrate kinase [Flavobacterium sp. VMW]OWU92178.1 carbohydrate kinase [Flavobacterium sp. NLM]PUU71429.1 carbohydrate kinase [Flavobacterium sp. WLB]